MRKPRIGILGAGAIGKRIIEDLLDTFEGSIVVLGRHPRSIKKNLPATKKLLFRAVDVRQEATLTRALRDIDLVIHAVHHEYNETVMKICLRTHTHYLDLGGLYHYTRKQLKYHAKFRRANLIAVLGMGAAPGITNVLAAYGTRDLDRVDAVEIRLGDRDRSTYHRRSPLDIPYSLQTLLEECSWRPAVYKNGKMTFVEPFSGRIPYRFPAPVGLKKPQYVIHSELATLPRTLRANNVFFKIAFPDAFVENMNILRSVGLLERENLAKTIAILERLPPPIPDDIERYEIIQVVVRGVSSKQKRSVRLEAHVLASGEALEKDTAVPASVVAQMILRGQLPKPGVFPPEAVVPPEPFFQELCHRGISIYRNGRKIF